jgi:hypothetical protein
MCGARACTASSGEKPGEILAAFGAGLRGQSRADVLAVLPQVFERGHQ